MQYDAPVGYSNTYATRYVVKPRQPILDSRTISTISTIFQYDTITPYGMGPNVVSNPDQDTLLMPGWGMIVTLTILAPGPATLTILVNIIPGSGTFTEIDTSPIAIAANAKVQTITLPKLSCSAIRGRLTGDGSTYTFMSSLTDY